MKMEIPLHKTPYNKSKNLCYRYSENSLHSVYGKPEFSQSFITRIPYATLIATIMCCVGVGTFCATMYRGVTLSALMFDQVFHIHLDWLETIQTVFIVVGTSMSAIGFMILFIGFLTTGVTRHRVYRAWRARVGGRISCAIYMGITYILQIIWLVMFCFLIIVTFIFTMFWNLCSNPRVHSNHLCIDLNQFDFMFPKGTEAEDMRICEPDELKLFCKDYVEKAEFMFIISTAACFVVILSLIHYLMCLSANYAHIRDHEKLQELRELQYLQDAELCSAKDRF